MLVHRRVTPHLYTWVERGTVGEECLAQEHNTMSSTMANDLSNQYFVELGLLINNSKCCQQQCTLQVTFETVEQSNSYKEEKFHGAFSEN